MRELPTRSGDTVLGRFNEIHITPMRPRAVTRQTYPTSTLCGRSWSGTAGVWSNFSYLLSFRFGASFQGCYPFLRSRAGSDRTKVVARQVVHLLTPGREDSLAPANIVAFTFTAKAAAELNERIVSRARQILGDVTGRANMFVGAIQAPCLDLLKSEVPKCLKFEGLNEVQQALFVDRYSNRVA